MKKTTCRYCRFKKVKRQQKEKSHGCGSTLQKTNWKESALAVFAGTLKDRYLKSDF